MARKDLDTDYWQELCIAVVISIILGATLYVKWKTETYVPVEEPEKVLRNEFGQRLGGALEVR